MNQQLAYRGQFSTTAPRYLLENQIVTYLFYIYYRLSLRLLNWME